MECEVDNANECCVTKGEEIQQEQGQSLSLSQVNVHETDQIHVEQLSNTGLTTPNDKQQLNRRSTLRPRKCISKDIGSNLRIPMKRTARNDKLISNHQLETIFEEPLLSKQGKLVFIGLSKAKRSITFSQFVTKTKLKKRKIKAKMLREKILAERKKMEDVETKLWNLGL